MNVEGLVLERNNVQPESEPKESSPPEEKNAIEEVTEVTVKAMEVERDTSQPEPVKPTHIWAKSKREVSGYFNTLLV